MKMLLNGHDLPVIWVGQYKCPYCKHKIVISRADFIKGIAVVSCTYCGKEAFTIEENGFSRQPLQVLIKTGKSISVHPPLSAM